MTYKPFTSSHNAPKDNSDNKAKDATMTEKGAATPEPAKTPADVAPAHKS